MYMAIKDGRSYRWATLKDFGAEKEGLLPDLSVTESDISGDWKKKFEKDDYIIEVDNKSITNRPDMWGHRLLLVKLLRFLICL